LKAFGGHQEKVPRKNFTVILLKKEAGNIGLEAVYHLGVERDLDLL
jgi:hypothetical protein